MIQAICKRIGAAGCYFLSLIYVADKMSSKKTDVVSLYSKAVKNGWMESDCYVVKPDKIVEDITGQKVSVYHAAKDYVPKKNEYEITRYEYYETGVTYAHFVVTNNGRVTYDPFGSSRTVEKGKPVSKRIIKIL